MIDEELLERQLLLLADQLEVPSDGAETIMALRDQQELGVGASAARQTEGARRARSRAPKKTLAVAAAAVVVLVAGLGIQVVRLTQPTQPHHLIAGVARTPLAQSKGSAAGSAAAGSATAPPAVVAGASTSGVVQDGRASGGMAQAQAGVVATVPGIQPRVVKTGSIDIEVKRGSFPAVIDRLGALATGQGGLVAASHASEDASVAAPSGTVTLRVPVGGFETLVAQVRSIGRVLSASSQAQDVTAQFVDLEARIHALEAARQQYVTLLTKANAIGDILNVQQHIADLQGQIEQLQGQQKVLDNQSSLSTLEVRIAEVGSGTRPAPPSSRTGMARAWHQAVHGFAAGAEWIVGASGVALLVLLIFAFVAVVGRVGWHAARRWTI